MRKNRQKALDLILAHEGGFAQRGVEPGGAVNMGITLQLLGEHWKRSRKVPGPNIEDLKRLTRKEAEAIYAARFLEPIKFDELPGGTDYAWLDFCVNSGTRGAVQSLGAHLKMPAPKVLVWLMRTPAAKAVKEINLARLARMQNNPHWGTYEKGWTKRLAEVEKAASAMMYQAPAPKVVA